MRLSQIILEQESLIRLSAFLGIFALVALAEVAAPRRPPTQPRVRRWPINIGIVVLNSLVLRFTIPVLASGVAVLAAEHGWGLFNLMDLPGWLEVTAAVILLDLVIYAQHVVFHHVPVLWRFHQMHHVDLDIDVTTGTRFHPVEILLSMGIKFAAVIALGAPAVAVVIFEVLLNGSAMFNHGNFRLPVRMDAWLRTLLVTPDMHRVHHSTVPGEFNSNFGFALSWWDRLFGTYRALPRAGHLGMTIGQPGFRDPDRLGLMGILLLPFRRRPATGPEAAA